MENQEINLELLNELESEFGRLEKGFVIDSDQKADWALQKLANEKAEYERIEKLAKLQIESIKEKLDKSKKTYDSSKKFFTDRLQEYFDTVDHKKTKTQESYKLLSGSLVKKFSKQKINHDDKALLNYLKSKELNEFIKVEESVKWSELKKTLEMRTQVYDDPETGEIISERKYMVDSNGDEVTCVTVEMTPEEFDVKF